MVKNIVLSVIFISIMPGIIAFIIIHKYIDELTFEFKRCRIRSNGC